LYFAFRTLNTNLLGSELGGCACLVPKASKDLTARYGFDDVEKLARRKGYKSKSLVQGSSCKSIS